MDKDVDQMISQDGGTAKIVIESKGKIGQNPPFVRT
jgi:hypothetical protein